MPNASEAPAVGAARGRSSLAIGADFFSLTLDWIKLGTRNLSWSESRTF
jgi:hypothetical protein